MKHCMLISLLILSMHSYAQTLQSVTDVGNTTNNFVKINGQGRVAMIDGLELFYDTNGEAIIQNYKRGTTNTYAPMWLGASMIKTNGPFFINNAANDGISKLVVNGGAKASYFTTQDGGGRSYYLQAGADYVELYDQSATGRIMLKNGNVGIGTLDTKGYKLAVAGNLIAEKIKVKLVPNWPDFVFQENYPLRTLEETEAFIKTYQHLPEIPSAAEIKDNGQDVGEMNAKLLQKVEEMTLYLIDLQKQVKAQQEEIKQLKRSIR